MGDDWYYAQENQQVGPVSWETLQALGRAGTVGPQTLVWTTGMSQWEPAAAVAGLFSSAAPPAYSSPQPFAAPGQGGLNYYSPPVGQPSYAGFWLRFGAYVIDWLIIGLPLYLLGRLFYLPPPIFVPGRLPAMPPNYLLGACAVPLVQTVCYWLYFAGMESSTRQATLGKVAVGLIVTDGAGRRISFGRATGRYFAKFFSAITLFIGYMMAGWTQRKQALHDMIADTLVLRK